MRISRKLMMVSAVALMGVSPLLTSTQSIQAASSTVYKTNSKTSVVRTIKNAHFVDQNGKSIPIVAEKAVSIRFGTLSQLMVRLTITWKRIQIIGYLLLLLKVR